MRENVVEQLAPRCLSCAARMKLSPSNQVNNVRHLVFHRSGSQVFYSSSSRTDCQGNVPIQPPHLNCDQCFTLEQRPLSTIATNGSGSYGTSEQCSIRDAIANRLHKRAPDQQLGRHDAVAIQGWQGAHRGSVSPAQHLRPADVATANENHGQPIHDRLHDWERDLSAYKHYISATSQTGEYRVLSPSPVSPGLHSAQHAPCKHHDTFEFAAMHFLAGYKSSVTEVVAFLQQRPHTEAMVANPAFISLVLGKLGPKLRSLPRDSNCFEEVLPLAVDLLQNLVVASQEKNQLTVLQLSRVAYTVGMMHRSVANHVRWGLFEPANNLPTLHGSVDHTEHLLEEVVRHFHRLFLDHTSTGCGVVFSRGCTVVDMARLLKCLGTLRKSPDATFWTKLSSPQFCTQEWVASFRGASLSHFFIGLVHLRRSPGQHFWKELADNFPTIIQNATPQQWAVVLYGVYKLYKPGSKSGRLTVRDLRLIMADAFSVSTMQRMFSAISSNDLSIVVQAAATSNIGCPQTFWSMFFESRNCVRLMQEASPKSMARVLTSLASLHISPTVQFWSLLLKPARFEPMLKHRETCGRVHRSLDRFLARCPTIATIWGKSLASSPTTILPFMILLQEAWKTSGPPEGRAAHESRMIVSEAMGSGLQAERVPLDIDSLQLWGVNLTPVEANQKLAETALEAEKRAAFVGMLGSTKPLLSSLMAQASAWQLGMFLVICQDVSLPPEFWAALFVRSRLLNILQRVRTETYLPSAYSSAFSSIPAPLVLFIGVTRHIEAHNQLNETQNQLLELQNIIALKLSTDDIANIDSTACQIITDAVLQGHATSKLISNTDDTRAEVLLEWCIEHLRLDEEQRMSLLASKCQFDGENEVSDLPKHTNRRVQSFV